MPTRWAVSYARVGEVFGCITGHPDPLHHLPGAHVAGRGQGDNFVQLGLAESRGQCGVGSLARIAVTPGWPGKTPADLGAGSKRSLPTGHRQADKPDELAAGPDLEGPQALAIPLQRAGGATHYGIGLVSVQQGRELLHHQRVRVQRGKGRPVRPAPLSQHQTRGDGFDQMSGHCFEDTALIRLRGAD